MPGPTGAPGCEPGMFSSLGRKLPLAARSAGLAPAWPLISRSHVRHLKRVALAPVPLAPSAVSGRTASQSAMPFTDCASVACCAASCRTSPCDAFESSASSSTAMSATRATSSRMSDTASCTSLLMSPTAPSSLAIREWNRVSMSRGSPARFAWSFRSDTASDRGCTTFSLSSVTAAVAADASLVTASTRDVSAVKSANDTSGARCPSLRTAAISAIRFSRMSRLDTSSTSTLWDSAV
mmetsp:Transcript_8011/g.20033  ORF Transcript_8011/g.20033 Transcript_8011/m.20033 type:complete len:238 (-) Transcript_8011:1324-2037(-)